LSDPIDLRSEKGWHSRNAGRVEIGLVDALRNHGVGYEWRDGRGMEIRTLLF
jgi:hypothetical protein